LERDSYPGVGDNVLGQGKPSIRGVLPAFYPGRKKKGEMDKGGGFIGAKVELGKGEGEGSGH